MSRPIKFRAWSAKDREYRGKAGNLMMDLNGLPYWQFGFDSPTPMIREDWIIEQYTGLTDKNGVEVYEADLLTSTYEEGAIYQVVWFGAGFSGRKGAGGYFSLPILFESSVHRFAEAEVIGNIHQHTDLLSEGE